MLRLHLTLPELEKGSSLQNTGTKGRLADIYWRAMHKEPVAIAPTMNHDHKVVSVILLTEDPDPLRPGAAITIKFRPVVSKTFLLCSTTKDQLLAMIIEFDHGQFWFDESGYRKCELTLSGNGTDPKIVQNSFYVLGEMLADDHRPPILRNVISYIQKTF